MKLSRRSALTAIGGALSLPYVRPSWAQAGTVNIYNWADYIGETTMADFEAETGIGVVYDLYSSAEEMEAKMLAGSTGYDLVLVAGVTLPQFITADIIQKLDRTRLTRWANLDPAMLTLFEGYDPGNAHALPYMWGSVGFTFNLDLVKERIPDADLESLDILLKPENAAKLADCGISILDSPTDIGFTVLSYLGLDPNTAGPAEYRKMAEAFAPIRQYIQTFDNLNYLNAIPNGELCMINNWSGDYSVAKARAAEAGVDMNLAYFVPKTGAPLWFDGFCLTKDAANTDSAYLFLDYLLRPEVIAAATNYTGYANSNAASLPFVDPSITSDPAIYPDAETRKRLYTTTPQTEDQNREITRIWAEIKAG